jgi:hypothetical protein
MKEKIIVVDDFYSNPDLIRALALKTDYNSGARYNYPGFLSKKRFVNPQIMKETFEKIVGKNIEVKLETFGSFRTMTSKTGTFLNVHVDPADWAALIFLTPNAPLDAGLGIYRHRKTGRVSPPTDKEARKLGFEDAQEYEGEIVHVHRDKSSVNNWELVTYVSPLYNRLVLIRGNCLYHAGIKGFGEDIEDARLTHNFFFNEEIV